MNPLVSVIVCTYNQADTLGEALDSILCQEVDFDYEIILANDASTDATGNLCRDYAARFPEIIRLIDNEENKGLVRNYYDALYECRGTFIADLAGDDRWADPQRLARQCAFMQAHPEVVLCHAAWRCLDAVDGHISVPENTAMATEPWIRPGYELVPALLQHRRNEVFVHLSTALYRRDAALAVVQKYPDFFYGSGLVCEDLQLMVLLATVGHIAYSPEVVLHYRVGGNTVSSEKDAARSAVFTAGVTTLTAALATELCADHQALAPYISRTFTYAVARALKSGSSHAARVCIDAASALERYSIPAHTRLALSLMRFHPVHYIVSKLYRLC